MLELVDAGPRLLNAYRGVVPDAILDDLLRYASELRGARVLHLNATPYGGGVSELLRPGGPILSDLGLVAHWKIIRGDDRFFQVTKKIHNGLQGVAEDLMETEREAYLGSRSALSRIESRPQFPAATLNDLLIDTIYQRSPRVSRRRSWHHMIGS